MATSLRLLRRDRKRRESLGLQDLVDKAEQRAENAMTGRKTLQDLPCGTWLCSPGQCPWVTCVYEPENVPEQLRGEGPEDLSDRQLSEAWRSRHLGLRQSDWSHGAHADVTTSCYRAGFCRCRGRGKSLNSFHAALMKALRIEKPLEQMLVSGCAILQLQGISTEEPPLVIFAMGGFGPFWGIRVAPTSAKQKGAKKGSGPWLCPQFNCTLSS